MLRFLISGALLWPMAGWAQTSWPCTLTTTTANCAVRATPARSGTMIMGMRWNIRNLATGSHSVLVSVGTCGSASASRYSSGFSGGGGNSQSTLGGYGVNAGQPYCINATVTCINGNCQNALVNFSLTTKDP